MERLRLKWWAFPAGLALVGAVACTAWVSGARQPPTLTVAAAYDLQPAFQELSSLFEKQEGIKIGIIFGASGSLARQIENGAPVDVFASANQAYVADLQAAGLIIDDTRQIYALGRLVLATNRRTGLGLKRLEELLRPEVKYIAMANPDHAPYGLAARQALERAGIWEAVRPKVVYGEDVRQALQFVQTGNAESGIVALSIAQVPDVTYVLLDDSLYEPLRQEIAVVRGSGQESAARRFVAFVEGNQGRTILKKYGFLLPGDS